MSGWGQSEALVFANKQRNTQIGFKLADTRCQVGRDTMHFCRRLRNATRQGDSVKHFQLRQVHDFLIL